MCKPEHTHEDPLVDIINVNDPVFVSCWTSEHGTEDGTSGDQHVSVSGDGRCSLDKDEDYYEAQIRLDSGFREKKNTLPKTTTNRSTLVSTKRNEVQVGAFVLSTRGKNLQMSLCFLNHCRHISMHVMSAFVPQNTTRKNQLPENRT